MVRYFVDVGIVTAKALPSFRGAIVKATCALGRSLQLSDEPVIERMQAKLASNGNHFTPLVDAIVTSPQFLNKRRTETSSER